MSRSRATQEAGGWDALRRGNETRTAGGWDALRRGRITRAASGWDALAKSRATRFAITRNSSTNMLQVSDHKEARRLASEFDVKYKTVGRVSSLYDRVETGLMARHIIRI